MLPAIDTRRQTDFFPKCHPFSHPFTCSKRYGDQDDGANLDMPESDSDAANWAASCGNDGKRSRGKQRGGTDSSVPPLGGGWCEIRTRETPEGLTVFRTVSFDRSDNHPQPRRVDVCLSIRSAT